MVNQLLLLYHEYSIRKVSPALLCSQQCAVVWVILGLKFVRASVSNGASTPPRRPANMDGATHIVLYKVNSTVK